MLSAKTKLILGVVSAALPSSFVRTAVCFAFYSCYFIHMSEKRKRASADTSGNKRRCHKLNTIETMMEITRRAGSSKCLGSLGRSLDLRLSIVCSVVKEKYRIKEHALNTVNISSKILSKRRGTLMEHMKRSSILWIEYQLQKHSSRSFGNSG
jgi:hypothetical protein